MAITHRLLLVGFMISSSAYQDVSISTFVSLFVSEDDVVSIEDLVFCLLF